MKSPLRQQQNSRAAAAIKQILPEGSVVDSFLLFDGAIELSLAQSNRFICAHTCKYVVYEFWDCALKNPSLIAQLFASKPFSSLFNKITFHILQENWPMYRDPYVRSALFFLLNRCSTTGALSSGDFTLTHLSAPAIVTLKNFKAQNFYPVWDETNGLLDSLKGTHQGEYLLLPLGMFTYDFFGEGISRGHEETRVPHSRVKTTLDTIAKKWIVVYRCHPQVFKLYKDYNIRMINKYGNLVNNPEQCEEVIVTNFK
tara:strand:+ start:1159 stop:1926 length:768 start_codon:yes stop_codon:yes gene_type:complete